MNKLVLKCYVDKKATRSYRELTKFKRDMNKHYPVKLLIEKIDMSDFEWVDRGSFKYVSDETVFKYTDGLDKNNIDMVMFFNDRRNWDSIARGFKLGRMFNSFRVCFTKYRRGYEDTAEHEILHAVDEFIAYYTGLRVEELFKVKDFDTEIVHYKNYRKDYDYDEYWKKLAPYLSDAINKRRKQIFSISSIPEKVKQTFVWESKTVVEPSYRYFTANEVKGLKHEFVLLLDKARHIAGIPFIINSGYRTVAKNKAVNGVKDSAHLYGLAVDLKAKNGTEKYKIVNALMSVGIKRIGVGGTFIHADIDYSKTNPTIYKY